MSVLSLWEEEEEEEEGVATQKLKIVLLIYLVNVRPRRSDIPNMGNTDK
jgi:hypothetical protein